MASTRRPSQAEQDASNARRRVDGGCTFADAPNAVTSAAAIVHQVSMRGNIAPRQVTRLSRVSSRASTGFTTIVPNNSSPARSFPPLTRIRRINRRPDQPNGCRQTGKRCFTNSGRAPRSAALLARERGGGKPCVVPKVILFRVEHSRRTLVPKIDFISAPSGSADNIFRPSGPIALITNRCLFDSDRRGSGFVWPAFIPGTASRRWSRIPASPSIVRRRCRSRRCRAPRRCA